ncbi:MAG: carboxypeptidase regulatory-like domain-containing protein, partial [Candidatus Cloacimonetes bacterium]|nr:carboxypeptidase regulatory-like domain-containing protein [Candidatus Cloacimonadota bacterium]
SLHDALPIFTADELQNTHGIITGIKLFNNFSQSLNNRPVKIWMGTTTLADLADDWIYAYQLQEVFNSTVDFPAGENTILINFHQAFNYFNGRNLVLLFQRPRDTQVYNETNYFLCENGDVPMRARPVYTNEAVPDLDPNLWFDQGLTGIFPKIAFILERVSAGFIKGTVLGPDALPMEDVEVTVPGCQEKFYTDASGDFRTHDVLTGVYTVRFRKFGYLDAVRSVTVEENEGVQVNVTMQEKPRVNLSGRLIASDSGASIANAEIYLNGYANYASHSLADGSFEIPDVYAHNDYRYFIFAEGYSVVKGEWNLLNTAGNLGDIIIWEKAYLPTDLNAGYDDTNSELVLSWEAPDSSVAEIIEGFEGDDFPPEGWTQIINNTYEDEGFNFTWNSFPDFWWYNLHIVPPHGFKQAGAGGYAYINEWLITPSIICPPDAYMRFETWFARIETWNPHLYVKISIDGGDTWTILWHGLHFPMGVYNYQCPILIDLSIYAGYEIKIAFYGGSEGIYSDYLMGPWFIDDVYIGNMDFHSAGNSRGNRDLVGYKIWRLDNGAEDLEDSWICLTPEPITDTNLVDGDWSQLIANEYRWAVKAVYDGGLLSRAVFSNILYKADPYGNVRGTVRGRSGIPLINALVSCSNGDSATTNGAGIYNMTIYEGAYSFSVLADDYHPLSYDNIPVFGEQITTLNFNLIPLANADDVQPVAATLLGGNYPNPFNPETIISYELKDAAPVKLDIYNLKGQLVRRLVNEAQASGRYRSLFDAKDDDNKPLPSGIYLYRLRAGEYCKTRKMILMQ